MDANEITILKRNEIIRGHSGELDINSRRLLNAIYWGIQKYKIHDNKAQNFSFSTLRSLMHLGTDERYVSIIEIALDSLMKPIKLRNYCHIDGIEYKIFAMQFISGYRVTKADTNTVEITFNKDMNELLKVHENFTKLEFLKYSNSFRSKYTVALYEYLKSFEGYKYIDMSMDNLNELLGSNSSYFSDLSKVVDRCIKEIVSKSDLKHIKRRGFKKDKFFRFYLSKDAGAAKVKKMMKSNQLFNTF